MPKPGRKTKYTPETVAKIVQAIKTGATYKTAFRSAGISSDTFYEWIKNKPEFAQQIADAQQSTLLSASRSVLPKLTPLQENAILWRKSNKSLGYKESELTQMICNNLDVVVATLGLAPIDDYVYEMSLGGNKRIDIFAQHNDETVTIFEVKSGRGRYVANWLLYPAIGQLLYYLECVIDATSYKESQINLVMLGDYQPDKYFNKIIKRTSPRITYLNVLPILRETRGA